MNDLQPLIVPNLDKSPFGGYPMARFARDRGKSA